MNCKGCKFAIINHEMQIGCEQNKVHKFVSKNKAKLNENNFFDIDSVCIFKRSSDWNGDLERETEVRMSYVFILKDSNTNELFNNLSLIKDQNPVMVYVISKIVNDKLNIINKLKELNCKYRYIEDYSEQSDRFLLDKMHKDIKTGWTSVNIVGEYFNPNVKKDIHKLINEELEAIGLILPEEDTVNNLCFFNIFFKYHKGSQPYYDESLDAYIIESFENKMLKHNKNMIKHWSDL